jgi:putative ABC transport system substrate-binding protein
MLQANKYNLCALLLIVLIPIWSYWVAPNFKKIPMNFFYKADILSIDNFYDGNKKKYEGGEVSKTLFIYQVIKAQGKYLVIKNIFSVKKFNDQPIFSVSRLYFINPKTGEHVYVPGQKARNGYLFAPMYANKCCYYYWHINYDAPAFLKFISEEKINNLTVYHYQAHYSSDQTANLHNLAGVPDKRGIQTNITLNLWIEPVSGWLVKYQDDTYAYYYDIKTGKYLLPWNHFSNQYTENSIRQQVIYASSLKHKIIFIDFIIPALLSVLALLVLLYPRYSDYLNRTVTKIIKHKLVYFIILVIFILIGESSYMLLHRNIQMYFIGISTWNNGKDSQEEIRGFKDALTENGYIQGKNIIYDIKNSNSNIDNQIGIVRAFVKEKAHLIYTLSTTGTLITKGITNKTPIIFSNVIYPVDSNIVESIKSHKANLSGVRNYIPTALQYYYFERLFPNSKVIGFVHHKGEPDSEVQLQDFKSTLGSRNVLIIDIPAIDVDDLKQQLNNNKKINALFLACDTLIQAGAGKVVAEYSLKNKIPSFSCDKQSILNGLLIGYIANHYNVGQLAGKKAALILSGAQVDWLKVDAPETGYLIINKNTAKELGIAIPVDVLKRANYIIDYQDKR